jgi:hypothetical protein
MDEDPKSWIAEVEEAINLGITTKLHQSLSMIFSEMQAKVYLQCSLHKNR